MSSPLHRSDILHRVSNNPILTARDWPYAVNSVMNAGATIVDGQTVLLCRVEDRRGFSHLTVARSDDGLGNWRIDPQPFLEPSPSITTESWGIEDPRVSRVDELGAWAVTYTSYGPTGPSVSMALTNDFRTHTPLGMICPPEDKNAALLPRRVDDTFVLYHRPRTVTDGHADIWVSRSPDLKSWMAPQPVLAARPGMWDSDRVGMGPPPLETSEGWLCLYHGVRITVSGQIYRLGLALIDLHDPSNVLHRSEEWVMGPREPYELVGDVPNVVFPCGWVQHDNGLVRVYYGAADTAIAAADTTVDRMLDLLLS